jgi:hemolysin activation/secretion protein
LVAPSQPHNAESDSISERGRLLKPYLGQCLGVRQLNELLKVITDHYIDKGLVNRPAILFKRNA